MCCNVSRSAATFGGLGAVSPAVAFNTAVSFVTNTNWQSYTPETTMSNLTQMVGLAVQNFVSAAVGLTVAVALIRGVVRTTSGGELGNFWVDLVRGSLRILLPLSFAVALILLSQGTIQSVYTHFEATALDRTAQHIALAPVASQEAIKEIGTNGGAFWALIRHTHSRTPRRYRMSLRYWRFSSSRCASPAPTRPWWVTSVRVLPCCR